MHDLNTFREWIDGEIDQYLDERLSAFSRIHQDANIEAYSYHLKAMVAKGKRIRPYLCYLGYISRGKEMTPEMVSLLVGLELFHVFCLVHDDVMDQSLMRRGLLSLHAYAESKMQPSPERSGRVRRVAEGQAILLGDLLFSWASLLFYRCHSADVMQEVSLMIDEVIAGQMIDIETTLLNKVSLEDIERKMKYKTASYSFVRPFRIGLAFAGYSSDIRDNMAEFAEFLGRAFQIQDDYLDLTGSPEVTGKPVLTDVREGQHTHFSYSILHEAPEGVRDRFIKIFNGVSDPISAENLQRALVDSGILKKGQQDFMNAYKEARRRIVELDVSPECKSALEGLVVKLEDRVS